MYLGIDLGTSAVKTVLVDGAQRVIASESRPLTTASPQPGYFEQDPAQWIDATFATLDALKATHAGELAAVEGIGLSGQMHGATLLDASAKPLRPCILWNDGRSAAECRILEQRWPALRATSGNKAMPGFAAPKLLWIAAHEPEIFAATKLVLLPKAYLRLVLTGEAIEDVSDASGSLWLDAARRDWSDAGLAATGLSREHMPRLVEGCAPAATLRSELAQRWGMIRRPMIAGGAGDNPAGAVGIGAIKPETAFISLEPQVPCWCRATELPPALIARCTRSATPFPQCGFRLARSSRRPPASPGSRACSTSPRPNCWRRLDGDRRRRRP
jgi:xylulokinase